MSSISKAKPLVPKIPEGRYSRLCPTPSRPYDPDDLFRLADYMRDSSLEDRHDTMPSGYVYFGQFVDHDLTLDDTKAVAAVPFPEKTKNFRTPRLDLDPLYGKEPPAASALYEDWERLRLGWTSIVEGSSLESTRDDLPRDSYGRARVIDSRSDENLIIAQMHVLWAKLHNRLLALASEQPSLLSGTQEGTHFERVRRLVTWIYQFIVVNDFLPYFIQNGVWRDVFNRRDLQFYKVLARPTRTPFALPIEFTVAAFRFGHSVVRNGYVLRDETTRGTETLLQEGSQLAANCVIDWNLFVSKNAGNHGALIDTFVAEALVDIQLPHRTLLRGSKMQLSSGEEFAAHFRCSPVDEEKMAASTEIAEILGKQDFRQRTPLWYYLLREAALNEVREPGPVDYGDPVQKLGQIGSRIIAETFYQVLSADGNSIFNAGRHWQPPRLRFGGSKVPAPLNSLPSIVDLLQAED